MASSPGETSAKETNVSRKEVNTFLTQHLLSKPDLKTFSEDFAWQEKFLPEIKSICGKYLIGTAPDAEDMQRNTDLIVLGMGAIRIACRVRQSKYMFAYGDQFTIRCNRASGMQTEFDKLISGFGDYIFYGFGNPEGVLLRWFIGDLTVFRAYVHEYIKTNAGEMPGEYQTNLDGKSAFRFFRLADVPKEFVIAKHMLA